MRASLESSRIRGDLLFATDFKEQAANQSIAILEKIFCHPFEPPQSIGNDEIDGEQGCEELILSIGERAEVVLTGLATNKQIERSLNLNKKSIHVFQVPRNGSNDGIQWYRPAEQKLLDQTRRYYSNFKANVYLISPGDNPKDHPSPDVFSGIIIANATRERKQKCVIVVSNSRGLSRRRLGPLEQEYKVAQQKCEQLTEETQKLNSETPDAMRNLKSHIDFINEMGRKEHIEEMQKRTQEIFTEFITNKIKCVELTKDLEKTTTLADRLQSWQDTVTIYHTDDLFNPSPTTVITASEDTLHGDPQSYLDMSTLVEWSPEGYERKLKQKIEEGGVIRQRRVHTHNTEGKDITRALFKMDDIHLVETYSVDEPWDLERGRPRDEVWVVKETLDRDHSIYIELDRSVPTKRHYMVYHYVKRSKSCLWTRTYKTLPDSTEDCKIQLIDIG